jgi:hypothetical protein
MFRECRKAADVGGLFLAFAPALKEGAPRDEDLSLVWLAVVAGGLCGLQQSGPDHVFL